MGNKESVGSQESVAYGEPTPMDEAKEDPQPIPTAEQLAAEEVYESPTSKIPDVKITLNVGGQKYSTTTTTLGRESPS